MLASDYIFSHNKESQQFILQIDKENSAVIEYTLRDNIFYLTHSEVPSNMRGKGIGKILVEKTFDYIEQQNSKAKAICSYIKMVAMRSQKWSKIII